MLWGSVKPVPRYRNFNFLSMSAAAILDIFKFQICNGLNGHKGRSASPCQISLKSLKPKPRYGYFSIFQNGGRRHVRFLKLQICKCRIASPRQITWQSVKPLSRYLDFGFFKMAAATILDFWICTFLTNGTVKKDELRHCAKFCQIAQTTADICQFSIFQDGGRRHLKFSTFQFF